MRMRLIGPPLIGFLLASFLCLSLPSICYAHAPDHPVIAALDEPGATVIVIAPCSCLEQSALPWRRIDTVSDLLDAIVPLDSSPRRVFDDEHRERAVRRDDALTLALPPPENFNGYVHDWLRRRPVHEH